VFDANWDVAGLLTVGGAGGTGTLIATQGGEVSCDRMEIGNSPGSIGVVAALVVQRDAYDEDALRDRMVRELAGHKRPKEIALLDALRLNRAGKVDRGATAQHARGSLRPI